MTNTHDNFNFILDIIGTVDYILKMDYGLEIALIF